MISFSSPSLSSASLHSTTNQQRLRFGADADNDPNSNNDSSSNPENDTTAKKPNRLQRLLGKVAKTGVDQAKKVLSNDDAVEKLPVPLPKPVKDKLGDVTDPMLDKLDKQADKWVPKENSDTTPDTTDTTPESNDSDTQHEGKPPSRFGRIGKSITGALKNIGGGVIDTIEQTLDESLHASETEEAQNRSKQQQTERLNYLKQLQPVSPLHKSSIDRLLNQIQADPTFQLTAEQLNRVEALCQSIPELELETQGRTSSWKESMRQNIVQLKADKAELELLLNYGDNINLADVIYLTRKNHLQKGLSPTEDKTLNDLLLTMQTN